MNKDFVYLDQLLPGIRWDAKYAGGDNFTGKPVEGYHVNRVVGTLALVRALAEAKKQAEKMGFGFLIWDAYRPQRAVNSFLRWAEQPEDGRTKKAHYPSIERAQMITKGYIAPKSGHSRGSAIDLTLYHMGSGKSLSMGSGFDLMDTVSHHSAMGITKTEIRNRWMLRSIMEQCGFIAYEYEWWHYNLANEPYPDTYFDFPIT